MTLPAAQRAITTARTSQGFSYTLKAPYEKAMQRYAQRPHSQNFRTFPFRRSCISITHLRLFQVKAWGTKLSASGRVKPHNALRHLAHNLTKGVWLVMHVDDLTGKSNNA